MIKTFIMAPQELCSHAKHVNAPYLRRAFNINKSIKKASLLISGLGFYDLKINGVKACSPLAPYISNPDDIIYYNQISVSDLLKNGENVLLITLGNGMQNAFGGYIWDFEKAPWRAPPCMALELNIDFEDGETQKISTEDYKDFLTSESPITFDDLRCGEYYDARLEQEGVESSGFDAKNWKPALLAPVPRGEKRICLADPIIISQEIKPVSITKKDDGFLYDFGLNQSGVCRLEINGRAGQEIILIHGEHILENGFMTVHDHFQPEGYTQTDKYICKGGAASYTPCFTYHGFRYVLVKGVDETQATPELLTYLVMHSDLETRGDFECSNETANKIQEITRRSLISNFHYFPTDCPHREKNGWMGDAAVSCENTLINFAPERSYSEWLRNINKAQNQKGALPGIIPTGGWGFAWGNGPAWDCALIYLPFFTYRYRGDKEILKENATAIFKYLHYLSVSRKEKGLIELGLGDWCPPGVECHEHKAPVLFTDSVIAYDICLKAAKIFDIIGWRSESHFAVALSRELFLAIRSNLIIENGTLALGDCQTTQAMALHYNLFAHEKINEAQENLLRLIDEANGHMDTGILGARVIFHVLVDMEKADLAYNMITRLEYPSYGNWVARGATTLWENFHPEEEKTLSRNHHFFGDVSNWFISKVAGINYNLGCSAERQVVIKPAFISKLNYANGYHIAPEGKYAVNWERKDGAVNLKIEVPENSQGEIILPNGAKFEDGKTQKLLESCSLRVLI